MLERAGNHKQASPIWIAVRFNAGLKNQGTAEAVNPHKEGGCIDFLTSSEIFEAAVHTFRLKSLVAERLDDDEAPDAPIPIDQMDQLPRLHQCKLPSGEEIVGQQAS